jgi:hypothetical protein
MGAELSQFRKPVRCSILRIQMRVSGWTLMVLSDLHLDVVKLFKAARRASLYIKIPVRVKAALGHH